MNQALTGEGYVFIDSDERLWELLPRLSSPQPRYLAFDVETTGLNPRKDALVLLQMQSEISSCFIIDCRKVSIETILEFVAPLFENPDILKVGHNLAFDYAFLRHNYDLEIIRLFDTMLAERLLTAGLEERASLAYVAKKYTGVVLDKALQTSFAYTFTKEQLTYAARDVGLLIGIMREQCSLLRKHSLLQVAKLEFDVLPALVEATGYGVLIDQSRWRAHLEHLNVERIRLEEELVQELTPYVFCYRDERYEECLLPYNTRFAEYLSLKAMRDACIEFLYQDLLDGCFSSDHPAFTWAQNTCVDLGLDQEVLYVGMSKGNARKAINVWKTQNPSPPSPPKPKLGEGPINLSSYPQLQGALDSMGVPLPRKESGLLETDRLNMQLLATDYPIIEQLLLWRNYNKLITSFGENILSMLDDVGRLHPEFNQLVSTGRLSAKRPNVQQIPSNALGIEFRRCFVAFAGYKLISVDYSQIELRVLAELSGEPSMLQAFRDGVDLHSRTAFTMFPAQMSTLGISSSEEVAALAPDLRKIAKSINFGIAYGLTPRGLSTRQQIPYAQAKEYIDSYFQSNPLVREWLDRTSAQGKKDWFVATRLGRKRFFTPIKEKIGVRPGVGIQCKTRDVLDEHRKLLRSYERMMTNHPIQGLAADINKMAMVGIRAALKDGNNEGRMVLFVHDEIVCEVPEIEVAEIKALMEREMLLAARTLLPTVAIEVSSSVSDYWSH